VRHGTAGVRGVAWRVALVTPIMTRAQQGERVRRIGRLGSQRDWLEFQRGSADERRLRCVRLAAWAGPEAGAAERLAAALAGRLARGVGQVQLVVANEPDPSGRGPPRTAAARPVFANRCQSSRTVRSPLRRRINTSRGCTGTYKSSACTHSTVTRRA
jgi:hypothetical protein